MFHIKFLYARSHIETCELEMLQLLARTRTKQPTKQLMDFDSSNIMSLQFAKISKFDSR